jgi:DNA-binding MarR family transcriptional regulator
MAASARSLLNRDLVQAVRQFNRFYTRQIGVLQEHLLHSQFSLTEVRVLYELAYRANVTAGELRQELGLDRGYLSRMLKYFEKKGWINTTPSPVDRRRIFLSLTSKGKKVFVPLDRQSSEQVAAMLARLSALRQKDLLGAMCTIESILRLPASTGGTLVAPPSGAKAPQHSAPLTARLEAVPFQDTPTHEVTRKGTSSDRNRVVRPASAPEGPLLAAFFAVRGISGAFLQPPPATSRRHGLGRPAAWRALLEGTQL